MSIDGEYIITRVEEKDNEILFYENNQFIGGALKSSPYARLASVVPFKMQYIQTEKNFKILGILPI